MNGLLDAPGWEISAAVRARQVSATEVAKDALERVRADSFGAVWLVTEERALREAAALDAALAAAKALDGPALIVAQVDPHDLPAELA